jgi:hypothetical protein
MRFCRAMPRESLLRPRPCLLPSVRERRASELQGLCLPSMPLKLLLSAVPLELMRLGCGSA